LLNKIGVIPDMGKHRKIVKNPTYATYISTRNPSFKFHKTKSNCILAVKCQGVEELDNIQVFKFVNNKLVELKIKNKEEIIEKYGFSSEPDYFKFIDNVNLWEE
jgi:hypothetical protein